MISRIDHISIAVKDYEKALYFFRDILGAISGTSAEDHDGKYRWEIFSSGDLHFNVCDIKVVTSVIDEVL